jgi:small GTP-binding protein
MSVHRKVCILGEFGVGKTSLVARYVSSIFSEKYHTTVGVKIDKKELLVDGRPVTLVLWDLAGESAVSRLKTTLVHGASGFLLVADGTRLETLHTAVRLKKEVDAILGVNVPFVFVVNKVDLAEQWEIDGGDLEELRLAGWDVRSSSAKTGEGVDQMFSDLAARLLPGEEDLLGKL